MQQELQRRGECYNQSPMYHAIRVDEMSAPKKCCHYRPYRQRFERRKRFSRKRFMLAQLATSGVIRSTMKTALALFPTWARLFFQPLLVLYYVPLFVLRSFVGPTRQIAREEHLAFLEKFTHGIENFDQNVDFNTSPVYA